MSNLSCQRVGLLFSDDVSRRAASYRLEEEKVGLIRTRFEQILQQGADVEGEKFDETQLALLRDILEVSEVKKENCHLDHFNRIQELIQRRAKFHYSSVPFLKYHLWAQFLICQNELGNQLVDTYNKEISEKQMEDMKLLYERTTRIWHYAYSLLFDNISKRKTAKLVAVLLDGSAAFMKFRGGHISEILAKHDNDFQFAKEHMDIVLNLCVSVNKPMAGMMEIFNEAIDDRATLLGLSVPPKALRVFFFVKVCQRIIDHENAIVQLAHKQLMKNESHLRRLLIRCKLTSRKN